MPAKSGLRWLLLPLILGVAVRVVVAIPVGYELADPDQYLPLARSLADGRGFCLNGQPTAYRPPLYPLLLAPLVKLGGLNPGRAIIGLHLVLSAAAIALVFVTARRWGFTLWQAVVAACVVAFDPVAVIQSRSVMTETLAAFLVALTLWAFTLRGRMGALAGGAAIGLCILCRPSLLPWGGLLGLAILADFATSGRERLIRAAFLAGAIFVITLPWAARNAWWFGEPIWTTTHGGYTLALANNPNYYADVLNGPPGAVWSGDNQEAWFEHIRQITVGMTQPQADRFLSKQGWRMLAERPSDFARASLARLGRFWGVAPSGAVYDGRLRWAVAGWTIPLWVALGLGLIRREQWIYPAITAPLLLISLTIVHAFYWTDMRMRVPTVPAIALIVAQGVTIWRKTREIRPKNA